MQIVALEDSLNEMLSPIFWENKKNVNKLSSAELAQRVEKVKLSPFVALCMTK